MPVSPQEFALIPNTVVLRLPIPLELAEAAQERQKPSQQAFGGIQHEEMIGFIRQAINALQEVRASMQHNVGVVQTIEEFLYNMFASTWQAPPGSQQEQPSRPLQPFQ